MHDPLIKTKYVFDKIFTVLLEHNSSFLNNYNKRLKHFTMIFDQSFAAFLNDEHDKN
jgi:hypothetical protein